MAGIAIWMASGNSQALSAVDDKADKCLMVLDTMGFNGQTWTAFFHGKQNWTKYQATLKQNFLSSGDILDVMIGESRMTIVQSTTHIVRNNGFLSKC